MTFAFMHDSSLYSYRTCFLEIHGNVHVVMLYTHLDKTLTPILKPLGFFSLELPIEINFPNHEGKII